MSRHRQRKKKKREKDESVSSKRRSRSDKPRRWAPVGIVCFVALIGMSLLMIPRLSATTVQVTNDDPWTWDVPNPVRMGMDAKAQHRLVRAREAVRAAPHLSSSWAQLGTFCSFLRFSSCAETCYRRALTLTPDEPSVSYLLATTLDMHGDNGTESVALFEKVSQQMPDYPVVHFRVAGGREKRGDWPGARDACLKAIELDPEFGIAHRFLGQTLLAMGDVESALSYLSQANDLLHGDAAVDAAMAQAYELLGDSVRAEQASKASRRHKHTYMIPDPLLDRAFRESGIIRGHAGG